MFIYIYIYCNFWCAAAQSCIGMHVATQHGEALSHFIYESLTQYYYRLVSCSTSAL